MRGARTWRDFPVFYEKLKTHEAVAALALRFFILTASRASEVLAANWQEIDFENAVWTIPAERMKAKRENQVPLCGEALEILEEASKGSSDVVIFEGQRWSHFFDHCYGMNKVEFG